MQITRYDIVSPQVSWPDMRGVGRRREPHERSTLFLQKTIRAALVNLIDTGWKVATQRMAGRAGQAEVETTEYLRDGMRDATRHLGPFGRQVTVAPGTESRSTQETRRPKGITDIPIYLRAIREEYDDHDPHAIVECKRISGSNANLCREYVVEGIDRFRMGKYAEGHAYGFMAGYVLSGDGAAAVCGVNRYLNGRGRNEEKLARSDALRTLDCWKSQHDRGTGREPIHLEHIFLMC